MNFASKNRKPASNDTSRPNPDNLELISNMNRSLLKIRSYLIASKIMFIGGTDSKSKTDGKLFLFPAKITRLVARIFSKSKDELVKVLPVPARLLNHIEVWTTKRSRFSLISNLASMFRHAEEFISDKFGFSAISGEAVISECEPEDWYSEGSCFSPLQAKALKVPVGYASCILQDIIGGMLVVPINKVLLIDVHNYDYVSDTTIAEYERFPTIETMGTADSLSGADATFRLYRNFEEANSKAESVSNNESDLIGKSPSIMNFSSEVQTLKKSSLMVYRPPRLNDGILYIPTAYEATLDYFGTLEVI